MNPWNRRGCVFFSSVRTAADTFCRTVGWDWPTGILIMIIMTSHTQKIFFEWEALFWNKILLQWWGWILESSGLCIFLERSYCCWYVLSYRTVGFCSKGTHFRPLEPTGTWIPGGWAPTLNPSIFRAFSAQPQQVLDCTGKNWFRAAPEDRIPKIPAFSE